jgi:hypothetical protein
MKHFNAQTAFTLLALACLSAVGCSESNNEESLANALHKFNEEGRNHIVIEDGVYPVVMAERALPGDDSELKAVELINVPVEGSEHSIADKIRVFPQPLLRFRKLSHFDFKIEKNECTEVGFQNTDELKAYTRDHIGSRLAVVVDNKVISHHKIREEIKADEVRITCCTVGGGDHLQKHLKELKLTSSVNRKSKLND